MKKFKTFLFFIFIFFSIHKVNSSVPEKNEDPLSGRLSRIARVSIENLLNPTNDPKSLPSVEDIFQTPKLITAAIPSHHVPQDYVSMEESEEPGLTTAAIPSRDVTFDRYAVALYAELLKKENSLDLSSINNHNDVKTLFSKTLVVAARKLQISTSSLKGLCRKARIKRWPYRQLQKMDFEEKMKTIYVPQRSPRNVSKEEIEGQYSFSLREAAKNLGISLSGLRERRNQLGMGKKWPFRKLTAQKRASAHNPDASSSSSTLSIVLSDNADANVESDDERVAKPRDKKRNFYMYQMNKANKKMVREKIDTEEERRSQKKKTGTVSVAPSETFTVPDSLDLFEEVEKSDSNDSDSGARKKRKTKKNNL